MLLARNVHRRARQRGSRSRPLAHFYDEHRARRVHAAAAAARSVRRRRRARRLPWRSSDSASRSASKRRASIARRRVTIGDAARWFAGSGRGRRCSGIARDLRRQSRTATQHGTDRRRRADAGGRSTKTITSPRSSSPRWIQERRAAAFAWSTFALADGVRRVPCPDGRARPDRLAVADAFPLRRDDRAVLGRRRARGTGAGCFCARSATQKVLLPARRLYEWLDQVMNPTLAIGALAPRTARGSPTPRRSAATSAASRSAA